MALEGKIVDFGVADILQLISQQQKTGALIVEGAGESVEILFWNGMILTVHSGFQSAEEQLGRQLIKSGQVKRHQLQKALEIQGENFKHLGEILVEMGSLSKEVLEQILHNQIYDNFSEIFQWKEGNYAFHPKSIEFNEEIFSPLGLEHIILDVLRMIDEWPDITRKVRSMDSIFRKTDRTLLKGEEGTISHEQTEVYKLVDGKMSVQDIAEKSLLGKFSTTKSIMELLEGGYIKLVPKKKAVTTYREKQKFKLDERIVILGCYSALALLVIVLVLFSPPNMKSTFSLFSDRLSHHADDLPYLDYNRLLKIKNGLQIYFWEKGKYPEDLKELVANEILHKDEIKNSKGELYYYRSKGKSYQLQR